MLRIFLTFLCCSRAWSDDASSFIQSGAVSDSMSMVGVNSIRSSLDSLHLQDQGDKLAVDLLMRRVKSTEKVSLDDVATFEQIKGMLQQIETNMEATRDADQTSINAYTAQFVKCNTDLADDHNNAGALETSSRAAGDAHEGCRVTEHTDFVAHHTICGALSTYMTGRTTYTCARPADALTPMTAEVINSWEAWWDATYDSFSNWITTFETKSVACSNAITALNNQITQCNQDQSGYETLFCEYRFRLHAQCREHDECFTNTRTTYEADFAAISAVADDRKSDGKVLAHIICLIDGIMVDEMRPCTEAQVDAMTEANLQTRYGVEAIVVPTPAACDVSPVAIYPGSVDWMNWAYGNMGSDHVQNGEEFHAPPANTGINCSEDPNYPSLL